MIHHGKNGSKQLAKGAEYSQEIKPQLEIGDFVSLNSGSPALKIVRIENDIIIASWHNGEIEQEEEFSKACVYKLPIQAQVVAASAE